MYEVKPNQSVELLKELHILTRDGKMNQDSRRKLKQIYHLNQFIEPLLQEIQQDHPDSIWWITARENPIWALFCTTCFSSR